MSSQILPALKRLLGLAALVLLIALYSVTFTSRTDSNGPEAVNGDADFSNLQDFNRPVELVGEWGFQWAPSELLADASPKDRLKVPGQWAGETSKSGMIYRDAGIGSYWLNLQGLTPGRYTLYIPVLYGATKVSIDGREVSSAGQIGSASLPTEYGVRSHTVPFEVGQIPPRIRIDIATSRHRDNGMEAPPVIGPTSAMTTWANLSLAEDLFLPASLTLIFVFSIVVYVLRDDDRTSLFLGLSFIFTVPIVLIVAHDNFISAAIPSLSFTALIFIQYVCGIFALWLFAAYAQSLFYDDRIPYVMVAISVIFSIQLLAVVWLVLSGETYTASTVLQAMYPVRLAIFLYIISLAVRAALKRREASFLFVVGLAALLVSLGLRAMVTNGYISADNALSFDFTTEGVLVFLLIQVVIMAQRWSLAIKREESVSDELRSLLDVNRSIASEIRLDQLLDRIVALSSKVVQAERSSLFLFDPSTDTLRSVVAEGMGDESITIGSNVGLAGHCFTSGKPLKIDDAYEDERFNREIDEKTGFRTGSVLALPIIMRDGNRVGVMQAFNSINGTFNNDDLERMQAFVAQTSVAIDNASLFAEVNSARNYNDSILSSMSSGVITLDKTRQLTKLNTAARDILQVPADLADIAQSAELLFARNPWLQDELDDVASVGGSRSLQDRDFATLDGLAISVNLSIVPLVLDAEQVGILILVEDITEGKRLQGAMRRFMTQEVFDRVSQQGDLLFGSACEASVLFADIRSFTTIAERQKARETVDMLNDVFSELVDAVSSTGGVLDKFIGDAVMAVYGAPIATDHDRESAIGGALLMLRLMDRLNSRRHEVGDQRLRLGIGIASGEVVSGTIGSPKRMDYTVIGDSVNLAARLQDLTKSYGVEIIICQTTADSAPANVTLRELDRIKVRGRDRAETIFEVIGEGSVAENRLTCIDAYELGRVHLGARNWSGAVKAFEEAVAADQSDQASQMMLERARAFETAPPTVGWDGSWPYVAKV